MSTVQPIAHFGRKQWLLLVLALIALYVLVPQLGAFRHSLAVARQGQWSEILLALGFAALSYPVAAGTYCLLAFHRLSYRRTLLLQLASTFANRLLPAGVGGIGTYYSYLRKSGHTSAQAAGVVAANNGLGIVGHMLLLSCFLLIWHAELPTLHLPMISGTFIVILSLVVVILVGILFFEGRLRQQVTNGLNSFIHQIADYRRRRLSVAAALFCSMGLTLCNMLSFWSCTLALHVSISFIAVVLVFTFGVALGTAAPTPGGLGGFEAGLVAGMVAYHVSGAAALAVALVYRLINYWLALALGAVAFTVGHKRGYI